MADLIALPLQRGGELTIDLDGPPVIFKNEVYDTKEEAERSKPPASFVRPTSEGRYAILYEGERN